MDRTLVPFDTFKKLLINEIGNGDFKILFYSLLRKLRLVSSISFKETVLLHLMEKYNEFYFLGYADSIYEKIDKEVLTLVQNESDLDTINVLISASPNVYVKPLLNKMGWTGSGSYFDKSGQFIHLYKENKIFWLDENFSQTNYFYHFAISDSRTDVKLLKLFSKSKLLSNN